MPQLDVYSIANQLFWGSFFFAFFYALLVFLVIPVIFSSLYARRAVSAGRSADLLDLAGLIFASHAFVLVSVEDIENNLAAVTDQLIYSRVVNSAVCEMSFELEFAQISEEEEQV